MMTTEEMEKAETAYRNLRNAYDEMIWAAAEGEKADRDYAEEFFERTTKAVYELCEKIREREFRKVKKS